MNKKINIPSAWRRQTRWLFTNVAKAESETNDNGLRTDPSRAGWGVAHCTTGATVQEAKLSPEKKLAHTHM